MERGFGDGETGLVRKIGFEVDQQHRRKNEGTFSILTSREPETGEAEL